MNSKNKKSLLVTNEGVSPVIGVILMVAITVIMAAIVASWGAGVKSPTTPTSVGLDISRSNTNITIVVTSIEPSTAAPLTNLTISYQNYNTTSSTFFTDTTYIASANVGDTKTFMVNSTTAKLLIITATYKDQGKKVLYAQET